MVRLVNHSISDLSTFIKMHLICVSNHHAPQALSWPIIVHTHVNISVYIHANISVHVHMM